MSEIPASEELGIEVYPCTQRLLDEAVRSADLPLVITTYQRDDGLPASFRPASKDEKYHEINVNTLWASRSGPGLTNYFVAHEATHAIRDFAVPREKWRFVTCRDDDNDILKWGRDSALEAVRKGLFGNIESAIDHLFEWERVMTCNLSGPEDIEVDRYVWQSCPELREAQTKLYLDVQKDMDNLLNGNSPYWEPLTSILCATCYPLSWTAGALTGKKLTRGFYNHPDAFKAGKELLSIVQDREPGPIGSIEASEKWIKVLGLENLFVLVTPDDLVA